MQIDRSSRLMHVILGITLVLFGSFAWYQYQRAEKAEEQVDLNATRMLSEVFRAKRDLRVGQLSGEISAPSNYDGWIFKPSQRTKAPVSVNYFIDLRKVGISDLDWDPKTRRFTVRIPDIEIERPNIDFENAEVKQGGVWIGRGAGIIMQRQAIRRITLRANERARDRKNIAYARRQAIEFVKQLVERPLSAVGYGPLEVRVIAPWDTPVASDRWDTSRSVGEVLGNAR